MAHLNSEQLAGQALGHDPTPAREQLDHLTHCAQCRTELAELAAVIKLSSQRPPPPAATPSQTIWQNIKAELANGAAPVAAKATQTPDTAPSGNPTPETPTEQRTTIGAPARSSRVRLGLLAAGVGLVVGVGATVTINQMQAGQVDIVAQTTLNPLPGHQGHGTAELVQAPDGVRLDVNVEAPAPGPDFREVWLINTDGKRMYSVGNLPPDGTGSFPVPAQLATSLEGFTIVDVSLEPYDGDAAHSGNSEIRGTLPQ